MALSSFAAFVLPLGQRVTLTCVSPSYEYRSLYRAVKFGA
jgi:hypothetical protein